MGVPSVAMAPRSLRLGAAVRGPGILPRAEGDLRRISKGDRAFQRQLPRPVLNLALLQRNRAIGNLCRADRPRLFYDLIRSPKASK